MKSSIIVFVLSVMVFVVGKLDTLSRPGDQVFFVFGIVLIVTISCVVYGIHTSVREENKRLRSCIK